MSTITERCRQYLTDYILSNTEHLCIDEPGERKATGSLFEFHVEAPTAETEQTIKVLLAMTLAKIYDAKYPDDEHSLDAVLIQAFIEGENLRVNFQLYER